jgi:hypothetical protein
VRGYITHEKGEAINWAEPTTSIAREKAQRKEVRILKNGGSMKFFDLSGTKEVSHKLDINVILKLPTYILLTINDEKPKPTGLCPYGILPIEFTKVGKLHVFLGDLLKWSNAKVLCMEIERSRLFEKIIRL